MAPPPTVAQFAPQAVKQIKKAPKEQSSRFGTGNGVGTDAARGNGPGGAGSPLPSISPPTLPGPEPVTHRCIGDPPRQIEDSQSPPCVPFWQGDNGGATWKGVTRDKIRIAVPFQDDKDQTRPQDALMSFFNNRFEFYGRKLELFNPGVKNTDDPQTERNDAAKVDAMGAFASLGYSYNYYYAHELARRHIISSTSEPYYNEKDLQQTAPYVWQYEMQLDDQFANTGAWLCNQLARRKASHAGDVTYQGKQRKFGIVSFRNFPELPVNINPLISRMKGCGATPDPVIDRANVGNGATPTEAQNTALELKQAGVTTVICTCDFLQLAILFKGATDQQYFPEWVTGTYFFNDADYALHTYLQDPAQLPHLFGLTFQPRELLPQNTPALWAYKEGSGKPATANQQTTSSMYYLRGMYHDLLLIASGIQMAGPHLTPQTFEAGLQRATFPNPQLPSRQGDVGFQNDHSMTDDGAEFYWATAAQPPYSDVAGQGALCYVEFGKRHRLEDWPKVEAPYGQTPCDSRLQ
jgi:hypothetical protein